jgi:hypothetical protein
MLPKLLLEEKSLKFELIFWKYFDQRIYFVDFTLNE